MTPAWLPNIISLDGPWEVTLAKLYGIFENDFIRGKPCFGDKPVWWDNRIEDGKYEEGFWHIISTGPVGQRVPDYEREKRLPWCAPTILNCGDRAVKCWDYRENGGEIRTYIWLEHLDYVIILEKRKMRFGEIAFLITAFHVGGSSTRNKLGQKYEQRIPTN